MTLLTAHEVAALLGVSLSRVRQLRLWGVIVGARKVARDWFYPLSSLSSAKKRRTRQRRKPVAA
jgi:hypothetical protein